MTMTEHWILHIMFEGTCNRNSNALVQRSGARPVSEALMAFYERRLSKQGRPAPYKSRLPCCM